MTTQREPSRPPRLHAKPLDRRRVAGSTVARTVIDERLRRLSEIGQVLSRADAAERTVPAVAGIIDRALPLRAMLLVAGAAGNVRSVAWSGRGTSPHEVRVARSHALRWRAYLTGEASWSAGDLWGDQTPPPRLARAARRMGDLSRRALTMPLGVVGGRVLGALLVEPSGTLAEADLVFLNQVASLFAASLDRQGRSRDAAASRDRGPTGADLPSAMIESLSDGVLAIDATGHVTFANPAAKRLLGWNGDPLIGVAVDDVLSLRHADGTPFADDEAPLRRALGLGEPVREDECLLVSRARGALAVGFTLSPLRWEGDGRSTGGRPGVRGAVLVFRDVPEVRRSERTQRFLALSATTLATSLDPEETLDAVSSLPVPVLADLCCIALVTDDGTIAHRPPVVARQEQPGIEWSIVRRDAPLDWESPQDQVLRRGETLFCSDVRETWAVPRATSPAEPGRALPPEVPVTSMVIVALKARGRLLGAITFAMTDSRRRFTPADLHDLEEVALRAAMAIENAILFTREKMATRSREDILAVVSHDLRNPLGVVIGGASLLLEMPLHEDRRRRLIQAIQRAAQRMRRLIGDLLDASCLDGGRLSMEIARQPADVLVRDAVDMVSQPPPNGRQLTFTCDAEPVAGAAVVCDRDRILQVFSNLIGNAIDFTPDGGTIRVGARREGDDVVFYVADDGPGIAPEHIPHVFERFWQLRRTPGPRKGLGLGLPIAQGIVETHGGRIWVESVDGAGSTFYFSLHAVITPPRSA